MVWFFNSLTISGSISTERCSDLDKLKFSFRLEPIFTTTPATLKNDAQIKSVQI